MTITVTVEFSDADRKALQRHWGQPHLPTKAQLTTWVRNLPQTTLVNYRYPEDDDK